MNDQAFQLRHRINNADKKAKTIAVISGKGGVGKSNITLNFTLELIKKDKHVLIIDLDIGMGNIDILLGHQSQYSLVDMYQERMSINDIIEVTKEGVSYISAGSGLSDLFNMDEDKFNFFLDEFEKLIHHYDYIFFDMGAGATKDSLFYILAADECFVITTPEPTAMMDAYAMVKHVYQRNQDLPFYILMNRSETYKEGKLAIRRMQQVVEQFLNKKMIPLGILTYDKIVSKAVIRQIPFSIMEPTAEVSKQLRSLVAQYAEDDINIDQRPKQSFVSKLKKFIKER